MCTTCSYLDSLYLRCKYINIYIYIYVCVCVCVVLASTIDALKVFLHNQFKLKDLCSLKYFLGLEVARCKLEISLCH